MKKLSLMLAAALLLSLPATAAKVTLVNMDGPGEGLNDPTRVKRVDGNAGRTLGEQRMIALQYAADIWGATLTSDEEIRVQVSFDALACTANSAVLASAGAIQIFADFPNAAYPATWYHVALANKLADQDLAPGATGTIADDIRARFNINLGNPDCFAGSTFYTGLTEEEPAGMVNLIATALHEFGHGLGFSNFVDETTGKEPSFRDQAYTDIFSRQIKDTTTGKTWDAMNNAERKDSAINSRNVVWIGPNVTARANQVLALGVPFLLSNSPTQATYEVGTASFGPRLTESGVTANTAIATDAADATGPSSTDACTAITNAATVSGKIAIVDRGACAFVIKAKNVQNAGALGMVVVDNVAGSPPADMSGTDATVTIPSVRVTLADGTTLKSQVGSGLNVTLRLDMTQRAGVDSTGFVHLNAPNPVQPGSSISHWDPVTFPNQLMEPAINSDLTHEVKAPFDLTFELFKDLGW